MSDPTRDVRIIGIFEGISFLVLLFVAMPLKYLAGMPIAVRIAGSVHGLLFIAFVRAVWQARNTCGWSNRQVGLALLASLLPFGPFVLDHHLRAQHTAPVRTQNDQSELTS